MLPSKIKQSQCALSFRDINLNLLTFKTIQVFVRILTKRSRNAKTQLVQGQIYFKNPKLEKILNYMWTVGKLKD